MLKYLETLKSRSDSHNTPWYAEGLREFALALVLLGVAMAMALLSRSASQSGRTGMSVALSVCSLVLLVITALTIVPRLARKTSLFRTLGSFSFSITREGMIFIIAVLLVALAAINTGNNLLFLILSTMLSAIIVSGIVSRASLRSVSVSVHVPENVFEGEHLSLKVSLHNPKRFLPAFSVSVEDLELDDTTSRLEGFRKLLFWRRSRRPGVSDTIRSVLRQAAYFPVVLAGGTRLELIPQLFPRRGSYRLRGFRLSTRFPFGFFKRSERVRTKGEIVVFPSIHELSGYFHLLPFLPGGTEGIRAGHGESLYAIRKYQPGDSARLVHWKATAKTGELMSREHARNEESRFCIILDTLFDPPMSEARYEEFEKAVRFAASLATHFIGEGAELEFLTPFEHLPRGAGSSHLHRILHSLALVKCEPAGRGTSTDLRGELSGIIAPLELQQILSDKIFKIIVSSKPRGSFTSAVWRSSHVVYFDEL